MSTFDLTNQLALSASGPSVSAAESVRPDPSIDGSPKEEAAAALVHLSGASSITVAQVEGSIPPNLAAASSLVDQLSATATGSLIPAAFGSLYTLLNPDTVLALTSD
jgi:uncharacterized protein with beta-barrel porin domain